MPRPGRLSAGPFNEAGFSPGPLDGKTVRRGEPPVVWLPGTPGPLSRTGGEPPFTQPRGFRARFAKPSGHRPHLAGNANRCIRDGTAKSIAWGKWAGILQG